MQRFFSLTKEEKGHKAWEEGLIEHNHQSHNLFFFIAHRLLDRKIFVVCIETRKMEN